MRVQLGFQGERGKKMSTIGGYFRNKIYYFEKCRPGYGFFDFGLLIQTGTRFGKWSRLGWYVGLLGLFVF